MVGRVVSVKMTRTAVVLVESKKTHPMYGKTYKWTKKYPVDDPIGVALGDVVIFDKIKPISKTKHWQISKVLGRDIVSLEQAELAEEAAEAIAEVLPVEEEVKVKKEEVKETATEETKKKPTKKTVSKKEKK